MNRTVRHFLATLVIASVLGMQAEVQADWYNPFSWGETPTKKVSKKEPGTLEKFNDGTKDFFSKTADFLNPFNDGESASKSTRYSYNGGYRASKPSESSWGWGSWFDSKPKKTAPETVSDFMDLERPRF